MAAEVKRDDPFGLLDGTKPIEEEEEERDEAEGSSGDEDEGGEPEPEPVEAEAENEDEPEGEAAEEPPEEPDPVEARDVAEDEPEGEPDDIQSELERERSHREGLQRALMEARQKNQQLRAQMAQQAPNPAAYAQPVPPSGASGAPGDPNQPDPPAGYQVAVAPDGQSVYVPREAIADDVRAEARAIAQQQMEEFRQEQERSMEEAFVVRDPQRHMPIVQEARMADEYVGLAMENAQMSGALYIDPVNPDRMSALIDGLRTAGIVDQVAEQFPNVGRHFDSFFRAWASKSPIAKAEVYSQIARPADPAPEAVASKREGRVVERVMDAPPSMARKGGASKDGGSDDAREFDKLYKAFIQSPGKLSDAELSRLNQLGVKLGKDGFDEE